MHRIKENKEFLEALVKTTSSTERKKIIKKASDEHLKCLIEIILNLNLVLDDEDKSSFRKQLTALKAVIKSKKLCLQAAKKILIKIHPILFTILAHILLRIFNLTE